MAEQNPPLYEVSDNLKELIYAMCGIEDYFERMEACFQLIGEE